MSGMRRHGVNDNSGDFYRKNQPQYRSLSLIKRAQEAIEFLMDHGNFVEYSKEQFAVALGWYDLADKPDRRQVETICNMTRDQHDHPEVEAVLGGYIVAYAPSQGGMTLVTPDGDQPLDGLVHVLIGDAQRQQAAMTVNRRRLPTWRTVGDRAVKNDDRELAKIAYESADQIDRTGFISGSTVGNLMKLCVARGLID